MSDRKPARFVNYEGDCRGNIGRVVGPRLEAWEFLQIVTEDYDADTDRTRVGFAFGVVQ